MSKIRKAVVAVTMVVTMAFGGLMLTGCPGVAPDGTVEITVPNVAQVADSARTTAAIAKAFYIKDDAPAVAAVLRSVVDVVRGAEGNVSDLIMDTVDKAIENGAMPDTYRTFILGIVGIADSYFQFVDFNVEDVVVIFEAAAQGLSGDVSVAGAPGFDW